MNRSRLLACLGILVLSVVGAPSFAADSACAAFYPGQQPPAAVRPDQAGQPRELCYGAFAVGHSARMKVPLWAAEHLTRAALQATLTLERVTAYHPEVLLRADDQPGLRDYRFSGKAMGLMASSFDFPTVAQQVEAFSMANVVPISPDKAAGVWRGFDARVRAMAMASGELYIVTGPMFMSANGERIRHRVMVPSMLFKAVYDPASHQAAAYVTGNHAGDDWDYCSIDELTDSIGIDVFPGLPPEVKAHSFPMPAPIAYVHAEQRLALLSDRQAGSDGTLLAAAGGQIVGRLQLARHSD